MAAGWWDRSQCIKHGPNRKWYAGYWMFRCKCVYHPATPGVGSW